MTNLSIFCFESHNIRFVGTADEPWWVAADICKVLAITDTSQAMERLDHDEKLMRTLHHSGQGRKTLCINESGLWSLILTSRKPQAKRFKKWVTSEVIPAIRKTGSYSTNARQVPCSALSRLTELRQQEALIRHDIKVVENGLSAKKQELQAVLQQQYAIAKTVNQMSGDTSRLTHACYGNVNVSQVRLQYGCR